MVAKKHDGGRGQAFVVFEEQAAATAALRGLTGETFYSRKITIAYSKTASNATLARIDPTQSRDAKAVEAARLVVSRAQGEYEQLEKERDAAGGKRELDDGEEAGPATKRVKQEDDEDEMEIEMEDDDDGELATVAQQLIISGRRKRERHLLKLAGRMQRRHYGRPLLTVS